MGLSVNQVFSHIKWVEWINENTDVTVPFPVIADELGMVSNELGMLHPGMGTNTVRAVFIMDDKSTIRLIMYYPQKVGRSVDKILRSLKALQISDKNYVAIPENWPNNHWLGDDVIVPSAATEEQVKQRYEQEKNGELKLKDWWFAHKQLNK